MMHKYASSTALLAAQLKDLFVAFNDKYKYATYYNKLSQTDNFETFVKVISQSSIPENAIWLKDNASKVAAYEASFK